ncbi:MAG: hypothetical protein E4G93_06200 [Dehalococcoidia bacterium]|nr:MAG: hypothetical protein E4G93_06200 [Dehalococcoidia bacterium]
MKRVVHAVVFAAILGLIVEVEEIPFVPKGLLLVALGGTYGFFVTGTRTKKGGSNYAGCDASRDDDGAVSMTSRSL